MKPASKGLLVIGVATGQCFLTALSVCIRSFARVRLLAGLKHDDYLLWIATVRPPFRDARDRDD